MWHGVCYFPKNAVYFVSLLFSVPIILMFFIKHVLEFKYQPDHSQVKVHFFDYVYMEAQERSRMVWCLPACLQLCIASSFSILPLHGLAILVTGMFQ
jgi:hypothetical protein